MSGPSAVVTTGRPQRRGAANERTKNNNTWGTWDNGPDGGPRRFRASIPPRVLDDLAHGRATRRHESARGRLRARKCKPTPAQRIDIRAMHRKPIGGRSPNRTIFRIFFRFNWASTGSGLGSDPLRALRLRITRTIDEAKSHRHLRGKKHDGKRVWLGEFMALSPLGDADLKSVVAPPAVAAGCAASADPSSIPSWMSRNS